MSKAKKLTAAAHEAAELRAHQTDPNVVALRIERTRALVDRLIWAGIVFGLLFTMANVQSFAAAGAKLGSIDWVIAWLLDPMVSLVLIGVLKGEQVINRAGLATGAWVRITKWVALGCTYGMNTWSAYAAGSPAKILLHSVPPLIVVCATEAITDLRLLITKAVDAAYRLASGPSQDRSPAVPNAVPEAVPGPASSGPRDHGEAVPGPVPTTVQDRSQDRDEAVLAESQGQSPKRSQARRGTTPKTSVKATQKGRVTQAEWENKIRKAIADHPGIDLNPSPIAAVLGLDAKTRASGGFKRAVTAVREETDSADHRLRAVNE
jgi:hypothetical protein